MGAQMPPNEIADRLYALPIRDFTRARNEAAAYAPASIMGRTRAVLTNK